MTDQIQIEEEEGGEGIRNLRSAHRAEKEAREAAERRVAELEAERRSEDLKRTFVEVGLPAQSASLYPADGEVTGSAVAAWASDHGIAAATQTQEPQPTRQQEILERANQFVSQSFARPSDSSSIQDLARQMYDKAEQAFESNYQPTDAEKAEADADMRTVNRINRQAEIDVRMGRLERQKDGFGGLTNPPYYADRTAQAQAS